jgi:hypothetical protein
MTNRYKIMRRVGDGNAIAQVGLIDVADDATLALVEAAPEAAEALAAAVAEANEADYLFIKEPPEGDERGGPLRKTKVARGAPNFFAAVQDNLQRFHGLLFVAL